MQASIVSLVFTALALGMMIVVNLGVTFTNSILPQVYVIKLIQPLGDLSIVYGPYNSCLMEDNHNVTTTKMMMNCTEASLSYDLDLDQLVAISGAANIQQLQFQIDTSKPLALHKANLVVLPTAILCFLSLCVAIFTHRTSDILPCLGGMFSIVGFVCSACGLAMIIFSYMTLFQSLQTLFGLTYTWGPSLYMLGISSFFLLIGFICFSAQCWSDPKYRQNAMSTIRRRRRRRHPQRQYDPNQYHATPYQPQSHHPSFSPPPPPPPPHHHHHHHSLPA
ncbi:uncharacterized protein BX664DRAFT_334216 [Halteromyces radiatus]|uniref:uncharacterized protein n=1 Tax=Halteromyces radiatus TaxID=101107 RepID=UPI00221F05F0|nr:uncharacterized protein BX664DRAFT_334216 [Halteromyces radiatus]KAI8089917.1 hypothetical protein BX664DRAFT_334216 [Halteromyces radiatus]